MCSSPPTALEGNVLRRLHAWNAFCPLLIFQVDAPSRAPKARSTFPSLCPSQNTWDTLMSLWTGSTLGVRLMPRPLWVLVEPDSHAAVWDDTQGNCKNMGCFDADMEKTTRHPVPTLQAQGTAGLTLACCLY